MSNFLKGLTSVPDGPKPSGSAPKVAKPAAESAKKAPPPSSGSAKKPAPSLSSSKQHSGPSSSSSRKPGGAKPSGPGGSSGSRRGNTKDVQQRRPVGSKPPGPGAKPSAKPPAKSPSAGTSSQKQPVHASSGAPSSGPAPTSAAAFLSRRNNNNSSNNKPSQSTGGRNKTASSRPGGGSGAGASPAKKKPKVRVNVPGKVDTAHDSDDDVDEDWLWAPLSADQYDTVKGGAPGAGVGPAARPLSRNITNKKKVEKARVQRLSVRGADVNKAAEAMKRLEALKAQEKAAKEEAKRQEKEAKEKAKATAKAEKERKAKEAKEAKEAAKRAKEEEKKAREEAKEAAKRAKEEEKKAREEAKQAAKAEAAAAKAEAAAAKQREAEERLRRIQDEEARQKADQHRREQMEKQRAAKAKKREEMEAKKLAANQSVKAGMVKQYKSPKVEPDRETPTGAAAGKNATGAKGAAGAGSKSSNVNVVVPMPAAAAAADKAVSGTLTSAPSRSSTKERASSGVRGAGSSMKDATSSAKMHKKKLSVQFADAPTFFEEEDDNLSSSSDDEDDYDSAGESDDDDGGGGDGGDANSLVIRSANPRRPISFMTDRLKEGPLHKLAASWPRNWKDRWFVLTWDYLYYFPGRKSREPVGSGIIPLSGTSVGLADGLTGKQFAFQVFHPDRRTFFLYAKSADERDEWMEMINNALDTRETGAALKGVRLLNRSQKASVKGKVYKQGYMDKRGLHNNAAWKRRWFVVAGSTFHQFKNFDDADPVISIPLENISMEWAGQRTGKPYTIALVHPERPPLFYMAYNRYDREDWLEAMQSGGAKYFRSKEQIAFEENLEALEDWEDLPDDEPEAPEGGKKVPFTKTVTVVKEGPLQIDVTLKKNYRKRYFVLTSEKLFILNRAKDPEPIGALPLKGYLIGKAQEVTQKKNTLHLFHPDKTNYIVAIKNDKDFASWYEKLRKVTAKVADSPT